MPITQILLTATTAAGGGGGGDPPPSTYPVPGSGSYSATGGTQGVAGTPYDPGGGIDTVSDSENGWAYYIKDGFFEDTFNSNKNINFFNGVTKTGADTSGGFGFQNLPKEAYAFQWVGYLPAPATGTYNIALSSDDLLYFWIGTNALEGNYTFSNYHALTNNNSQFATHSLSLTAGKYYPVRMWFQEWSGAERAQVFFGLAGQTVTAMNDWAIVNNSQTEGHNPPTPTYTITPAADNVDEGSSLEFVIGGTNISNGTYFWTVAGDGPFDIGNGSFTITDNAGSVTVTPQANQNTDGAKAFTLSIRSFDVFGTVLATSESVTINDTSLSPVAPFSLVFNNSQQDFLRVPASLDFNLGTTWTIEFWMSANGSGVSSNPAMGNAGLWGLLNQGGWTSANQITVAISDAKLCIGGKDNGDDVRFTEPNPGRGVISIADWVGNGLGGWDTPLYTNLATSGGSGSGLTVDVVAGGGYIDINSITINNPGTGYTTGDVITINNQENYPGTFTITAVAGPVWTHVAVVNNAGTQKVYYNGVEQSSVSGTFDSGNYTSSSEDIYIGRLAPNYGGYFDGRLALIRISDVARYTSAFTHTTTYGVDSDTVLFLDSDTPLTDASASAHIITNNGVTISTDFPQTFIDHAHPNTGGDLTATFSLFGDPNITAFAAIPAGARITSNIAGFGTRLVIGNSAHVTGRMITYDGTGLSGTSSTSDRYNFYW